jgi:exodeoxyribonuclease VII small subunit
VSQDTQPSEEPTFEQAQRELEEIVGRLERGDVPIDDAVALARRGEELYRRCVALLDSAEGRIEELTRGDG